MTFQLPGLRGLAGGCAVALAAMAFAACPASGQATNQAAPGGQAGDLVLVFPTGDRATGNLLVEVASPTQVPVGRTYDYRIRVTNITKNLVLDEVTIHQTKAEGFSIETSEPGFEEGDGGAARWSLETLKPGESKTITVSAQADKEGEAAGCLRADYKAALCLTTRFVKPDLKVTKDAPEDSDLCDVLTYRYTVRNTGSGAARAVKVRDELPEGLTTTDGRKVVEYDAGDLPPNGSREFTAKLQASKTGDFASRAVAKGEGDLEASSNKPSTAIRQAKLAVRIEGPESMYVNQPMTYRVEVRNEGEAPAREARLQVQADRGAKLLRTSKAAPGGADPQVSGDTLSWDLGTVEPGRAIAVSMTVVGRDEAELKHVATATSACARGGDVARAATATMTAETRVLTFPALLLQLVDRVDPVRVGDTEVYRVTVLNQGSGPDQDVKVKATLPEQFRFVDARGDGDAKADGREVTLGPIERLGPGERAVWDLSVKPEAPGDVRMKVELSSEYLSEDRPAVSIESTRILGAVSRGSGDGQGGQAADPDRQSDPASSSTDGDRASSAPETKANADPPAGESDASAREGGTGERAGERPSEREGGAGAGGPPAGSSGRPEGKPSGGRSS